MAILQLRELFCFVKHSLHPLNKGHRSSGIDLTPYSEERENQHLWKPRKSLSPPQMYATKREGQSTKTSFLEICTVVRCIYFIYVFFFKLDQYYRGLNT